MGFEGMRGGWNVGTTFTGILKTQSAQSSHIGVLWESGFHEHKREVNYRGGFKGGVGRLGCVVMDFGKGLRR